MLLLAPLRLLRLLTIPPRIVAHMFFLHRLGSLKLATTAHCQLRRG